MCHNDSFRKCVTRAIAWKSGAMLAFGCEKIASTDCFLSIVTDPEGAKPPRCNLEFKAEAVKRTFVDKEPGRDAVHMFRYVTPLGTPRMMAYCTSCGHTVTAAEAEIGDLAAAPCPGCGTEVVPHDCVRWHNWGLCLDCPEDTNETTAAKANAAAAKRDAEFVYRQGFRSARSEPTTNAGPATNQPMPAVGHQRVDLLA